MQNQVAVQNKNLEQVQTGLTHLKSGDEKYEIAIGDGKRIINSSIEEIKEVLRLAMLKLGIRGQNLPDEEEKMVLINHIAENYGNHTCGEITLAFDLAISDKLEIDMKDVKAYENFSCLYFSSIMNAYRKWSLQPSYNLHAKKQRLALPYFERKDLSEREMEEWIAEWNSEKVIKMGGVEYIPLAFHKYLTKKGKLSETSKQKEEYIEQAKKILEAMYLKNAELNKFSKETYLRFKEDIKNDIIPEGTLRVLTNTAKKIAVYEYFKTHNS